MEIYSIEEQKLGIVLYRGLGLEEINVPERLEKVLHNSDHEFFRWKEALVGYNESMPEYRDCVDLKMSPVHWDYLTPEFEDIRNVYNETDVILKQCLKDYEARFNFKMEYMEAINFIKYEVGQHFQVHSDDGFSYSCTVSTIAYFNDNYEGGELWFPNLNIKFKPAKGDIVFFPSNYIYSHAALAVTDGTKYSAVTMFDYNDRTHKSDHSSNQPVDISEISLKRLI